MSKKQQSPIIQLNKVWKTYTMGEAKVHALRGINFEVREGEFIAIMGTSGSGKSTMMNLVGALDVPSKGTIHLQGRNIAEMSESDLAQLRGRTVGFIFQKFNLIDTLTAKQNVTLPLMFQGINEEERDKRGKELLTMVELADRMNHRPNELSGGQQQRVAIARALAAQPKLILADEPTGNLDTKTGDTVMSFLKKLHKQGTTIVMVTHDKQTAKNADRIEVLRDGQIITQEKK
ncbi:MAG: ABC transporter ATP-binding protein [Candidatus Woesearchaeota archaeon]